MRNPTFGDGTPGGLALALPGYGVGRIAIDGAFSPDLGAWSELALAVRWLAVLRSAINGSSIGA